MTKLDLGQAISILANVGVIGGLIFVGVQLKQDREIATIDRRIAASDSRMLWAELVTANGDLWAKGLAGEPLTPAESVEFDVLASALGFDWWQRWANYGISSYGLDLDSEPSTIRHSVIREAALELYSHPGLLDWHRNFEERLKRIGRHGEFYQLIEDELDILRSEDESN